MKITKKLIYFFAISLFTLSLVACSKLSQSNFDKVQTGMSMQQVVAILGEPTSAESSNVAGLSGTKAVWKDQTTTITVIFFNNAVQVKTMTKAGDGPAN